MPFNRQTFEALLARVEKPGRYLGNERGAVRKDPGRARLRFALAFPEVYEIAQSHLGLQILYDLLNRHADVCAERVYAPWFDLEALLRQHAQPLVSLESLTPLSDFHMIGFSLQYELTYTNLLMMLDLGGIPLRTADRTPRHPVVIAGGPCAFNPEPLADFLDAVLLGDGEEAIGDLCDAYLAWDGRDRAHLLRALSRITGVYVPAFYAPRYAPSGRLLAVSPVAPDVPPVVEKRIVRDLDSVPQQDTYIVPNLKVVHARPSLEVMRGCVKGCRFCQAGYIYRPLRERDPRRVLAQADRAVAATGTEELTLLSLSTGDYSCVNPLLTALMNRHAAQRVALSLPSTRVDALAPELLEQIRRVRKTGFTLAPEAGSQRLRDIIQKEYSEHELIEAARRIFQLGWQSLKLYFMIGLPGETEEDIVGIAELSARVAAVAPRRGEVTASVSTFVPKPHTPFQWAAQIDLSEIEARQALVRRELHRRGVRFKWQDARASCLEGIFARGDRRLGASLLAAYRLGCRFDGWTDACRFDLWERALAETGIRPPDYLRRRHLDEVLPWDHLSCGVSKAFLQRELARAVERKLTPDCSVARCTYCGACDFTTVRNITYHVSGAKGGEHRGEIVANWAQGSVNGGAEAGAWEPRGWHKIQERGQGSAPPSRRPGVPTVPRTAPGATGPPRRDWNGRGEVDAPGTRPRAVAPEPSAAGERLSASSAAMGPPERADDAPTRTRVRLIYEKTGGARFISHLELVDVLVRAFRRARLPIAYSRGHRPKPRFRFSPGLPVGAESDCEVLDIDLTEALPPEQVAAAIAPELPPGLSVVETRSVSLKEPSPDTQMIGFRYRIGLAGLDNGNGGAWIDDRFARFLVASRFVMRKRTPNGPREIDARPLVMRLERTTPELAEIDLRFGPEGTVKPTDLLAAVLNVDAAATRVLPVRKTLCFYRSPASTGPDTTAAASAPASHGPVVLAGKP